MEKEIVFVFVEDYPDWESAEALYFITVLGESRYTVRSAGITREPIRSLSDVCILPDYAVSEIRGGFVGLILVGGIGWTNHTEELIAAVRPAVEDAAERGCPIGGVGTGADILGAFGILNRTIHTGNSIPEMNLVSDLGHADKHYAGEEFFHEAGAVRNGNIVTAKNISGLAFARAYMWTLDIDQQKADALYEEHRKGAELPAEEESAS